MARPPDADSAETYERILDAALDEVCATVPRNGISMRKVATRAGVSLGTLQYYFEHKTGLLEACLDAYYERLDALGRSLVAQAAQEPEGDVSVLVAHAVRSFYDFIHAERPLIELRRVTNALRGEPHRSDRFLSHVIAAAAEALTPRVALSSADLRLSILSAEAIIVRMALIGDNEREALTGLTGDEADAAIRTHAVTAALRLLQPT